ncbi:MAG TPA: DUF4232 domain-containing protein [Thermomicrobiales bacterium]|nr:DUF4232 domain-containing protein [Thermomicrobiales bacterium]
MDEHSFDRLARNLAHQTDRRTILGGVIAAGAALFGIHHGALATPQNEGGLVFDYYQAIDRRAFRTAYGCLGAKFRARQTLQNFTAGFTDTVFDDLVINNVRPDPTHNQVDYDVTVTAWHTDGSVHRFTGTYIEGREAGVPKLIDAAIKEVTVRDMAPLCAASDLHATMTGDAGAGQRYGMITATNVAAGSCVLGAIPRVTVSDGSGNPIMTASPEPNVAIPTITLAPGQSATLGIHWSNWCGAPVTGEPQVAVAFRGGKGRITGLTGLAVPPCLSEPGGASTLSVKPWQNG